MHGVCWRKILRIKNNRVIERKICRCVLGRLLWLGNMKILFCRQTNFLCILKIKFLHHLNRWCQGQNGSVGHHQTQTQWLIESTTKTRDNQSSSGKCTETFCSRNGDPRTSGLPVLKYSGETTKTHLLWTHDTHSSCDPRSAGLWCES